MINKSYSSLSDKEAIIGASSVMKGWGVAGFLFGAFNFVVGIGALPLRLILRDNIGERSVRPGAFLLSIILHVYYFTWLDDIFVWGAFLGAGMEDLENSSHIVLILSLYIVNPYTVLLLIVLQRGIKHFKEKIFLAKTGNVGYSYYRGDSRFFREWDKSTIYGFPVTEDTRRILVEPKAVFTIGISLFLLCFALLLIDSILVHGKYSFCVSLIIASLAGTGLAIGFDALCLAVDEISLIISKRDKILDILDSEEDAKTIVAEKEAMKLQQSHAISEASSANSLSIEDDFVEI